MNVFKKFRKFKKNAKALSPVIATIILIAVTVAVSVVVAAWMGALTLGFMGNAEQAKVTNVVLANTYSKTGTITGGSAVVTIQNTGSSSVTITSANIDGTTWTIGAAVLSGTATPSVSSTGQPLIAKGTSVDIPLTLTSTTVAPFTNSAQYTVNLMTAKGNTETSQATYSGP
jgi:flagellin-like protein